ncbi:hypothetical protein D1007_14102 [Hordeum vulgare]|nr:hypothetical protein D1007_14102 [Hordeum vulgare]
MRQVKKKREKATKQLRLEPEIIDGLYHREGVINIEDDDDDELQMALHDSIGDKTVSRAVERRRGSGSGVRVSVGKRSITAFFDKELWSNKVSMQPRITTAFDLESGDAVGQAWAKFFHANDIAGLKADCPHFRATMKITEKLGPSPLPTAKEIHGIYLDKNYDEATDMKKNVGGELIKPNATRFGTVFMFLESYHEKKDQFTKWMVSDDWKTSIWKKDVDYVFAEALLSSNMWSIALEWVLYMLEPHYRALRWWVRNAPKSHEQVSNRIDTMEKYTLMVAAAVLDPYTHYMVNLSNIPNFASALTDAIEKIADPYSVVLAVQEIITFREKARRFGQRIALMSAEKMSPMRMRGISSWMDLMLLLPGSRKYVASTQARKPLILDGKHNATKRKRMLDEAEDDYNDSEDDDQEDYFMEIKDDDGSASQADGEDSPSRVDNEATVTSDGGMVKRRTSVW